MGCTLLETCLLAKLRAVAFLCWVGAAAFELDPGWREKICHNKHVFSFLGGQGVGSRISAHAEQLSLVQRGSILICNHQSSILLKVSGVLLVCCIY